MMVLVHCTTPLMMWSNTPNGGIQFIFKNMSNQRPFTWEGRKQENHMPPLDPHDNINITIINDDFEIVNDAEEKACLIKATFFLEAVIGVTLGGVKTSVYIIEWQGKFFPKRTLQLLSRVPNTDVHLLQMTCNNNASEKPSDLITCFSNTKNSANRICWYLFALEKCAFICYI